jgi:hypothetical protein
MSFNPLYYTSHDTHTDSLLSVILYFRYTIHSIHTSSNLGGSKTLPDDGRLVPKDVGANTQNKGVIQISAYCWFFNTLNKARYEH